jgi:Integrase core domain
VTLSHGRTGQCWDNALAESFFASIKGELPGLRAWPTKAAAKRAIVEYIAWYNGTRLHSTLGYRSPAEFEEHNNDQDSSLTELSALSVKAGQPQLRPANRSHRTRLAMTATARQTYGSERSAGALTGQTGGQGRVGPPIFLHS